MKKQILVTTIALAVMLPTLNAQTYTLTPRNPYALPPLSMPNNLAVEAAYCRAQQENARIQQQRIEIEQQRLAIEQARFYEEQRRNRRNNGQ